MANESQFQYRAFISYSSRDRIIGERFQAALERYRIPRVLRDRETSQGIVPNRVTPIFRDRWDLEASGDLGQRIDTALRASRSLIVLCSPYSARSQWVNQEILTFKKLGRGGQITAVLVDGEPVTFDEVTAPNGAFPPALMYKLGPDGFTSTNPEPEPFAPDLREMRPDGSGGDGFEYAKLKVVARLIDVPLAELTQRQRAVERRERRVIQAVAAAMMVLAIGATAGGWIAWRKSVEANARLNETIDTAARQIGVATTYRDRYGVPTKVIEEILSLSRRDFSRLFKDVEQNPQLRLQKARLSLTFADAYGAVDEKASETKALQEAEQELAELTDRKSSILEQIGLVSAPSAEAIALARLRLMDANVKTAQENRKYDLARRLADMRLALAQTWLAKTGKPAWQREVALSRLSLATVHYLASNPDQSRVAYEKGIEELEALLSKHDNPLHRQDLFSGVNWRGQLLVENAAHREGLAEQQRAEKIASRLLRDEPQNKEHKRRLAQAITSIGDAMLNLNSDAKAADEKFAEAERLFRELAGLEPERMDWQHDIYIILERRISALLQLGRLEQANAAMDEAVKIVERRLAAAPRDTRRLRDVAYVQERLAQVHGEQADALAPGARRTRLIEKALSAMERTLAVRTKVRDADPADPVAKFELASANWTRAKLFALVPGRMTEAWQSLDEAYQLLRDLTKQPDNRLGWFYTLAVVEVTRSQFFQVEKREVQALSALRRALNLMQKLRKAQPDNQRFSSVHALIQAQIDKLLNSPK